jgi:hypothetical protein
MEKKKINKEKKAKVEKGRERKMKITNGKEKR